MKEYNQQAAASDVLPDHSFRTTSDDQPTDGIDPDVSHLDSCRLSEETTVYQSIVEFN
jgi:hypothetical protein